MSKKVLFLLIIFCIINTLCQCQEFWESIYSSEDTIYCMTVDSNNNIFLGMVNGVLRSTNDGLDWELVLSVYQTKGIASNNQDFIYASPYPLYLSIDSGENWNELNMTSFEDIVTIFEDSQQNIFAGFWGGIYKSSNGGDDWDLVLSVESMEVINQIVENSEGILFAGSINYIGVGTGGIYKSINHGDSWELSGLEQNFISSLSINSNDEIFVGSRGHYTQFIGGVFYSSGNGTDWIELRNDVLVTSIVIDSEDNIYIGCSDVDNYDGAVQYSEDNGETWQIIESELITPDVSIEFLAISNDNYLYAISYESVSQVYRSVQPILTGINKFLIPNIDDIKLTNYPNPFNPSTTIEFLLPYVSIVNLSIFNLKGQKIKTLADNKHAQGSHSIVWNGDDEFNKPVSSGIYFYKLNVNGKTEAVKKCLLLK